jgi:hypothetical protein
MSELHTCPGCCGRFQCAAFAALRDRDETIARLTAAVEACDAAVREYIAARDALDAARCAYLAACRTQDRAAVLAGGRAIAELSARTVDADASLRALTAVR